MKVNIIILNYNGLDLLKECLPSVIEAANSSIHKTTVTVLDNCSTDASLDFLKENFKDVKIMEAEENRVYSSYNKAAEEIDDDIMIVLNNDIKLDKGFIDPLVEPFSKNRNLFFVAARGYSFNKERYEGDKAKATVRWGILEPATIYPGYEKESSKQGYTFSAGVGAFDRKKFIELGGYDDIYFPGRYEDVDFCYRGWKRGWKGVYQPKSILYHKGAASFKKSFHQNRIARDVFRNSIIFMLKNITDGWMLMKFCLLTAVRILLYLLFFRFYMVAGALQALRRLPAIMIRREKVGRLSALSDREVLKIVNRGR